MRRSLHVGCGLLFLLLPACGGGKSSELPAVKIEKVRVGLPAGPESSRSRPGAWCPVYVTLKAGKDAIMRDTYRLVVKTTDADDIPFRYTVAVPYLDPETEQSVLTYTRPGSSGSDIEVQVTTNDGKVVQALPRLQRNSAREVLEPKDPLLLAVGSRTLRPDPEAAENEPEEEIKAKNLAYLESVAQMPDQWFGYDGVDVVVLATGKKSFMDDLTENPNFNDRRDALVEWVRRGGRLVLSVGRNHQAANKLLEKTGFLACELDAPITLAKLPNFTNWARATPNQPLQGVEVAVVKPRPKTTVLVTEGRDPKPYPVVVQGTCGLGRVLLVAFDLEDKSFAGWVGRKNFWEHLQIDFGVRSAVPHAPGADNLGGPQNQSELLSELQRNLENFEDVPVISFGWVALFILFYIVLVGPLDYFILKKIFKRLELTWITFPVTVLLVSVTAYFTAYALKGDDLRINKIDVVEIDLNDNTATGTTWFSLFSPRIQNYTLGVEPSSPTWVAEPPAGSQEILSWTAKSTKNRPIHPTMVAVLSSPEQSRRAGSSTLYPQPYDYTVNATGVEKVPIPVWATRSFTASWAAPLPKTPPIEAKLTLPAHGKQLPLGEIVNHLPVRLHDAALFYHGEWSKLGTLEPGEPKSVNDVFGRDKMHLNEWVSDTEQLRPNVGDIGPGGRRRNEDRFGRGNPAPRGDLRAPYLLMKQALFYTASDRATWQNSGLRPLDQTWRLTKQGGRDNELFREEVVLVARVGPQKGKAEELTEKGVAPTALWLHRLPGTEAKRPEIAGFLSQETYIRVYIPVVRGQ